MTMMRVGEGGNPGHAQDEYLYVPPGSQAVVAPRPEGEEPTMHHAVAAILEMMAKEKASGNVGGAKGAVKKKLPGAATGASIDLSGGGMDQLSTILSTILGSQQMHQQGNQFGQQLAQNNTQFYQNQGQAKTQFDQNLELQREKMGHESQAANNQLEAQNRSNSQNLRENSANRNASHADLEAQLANALGIARMGNDTQLRVAKMQNDTARAGQQNQYALGVAQNKLTARQQLAERGTRQLVGPTSQWSSTIPSMAI